MCEWTKLSSIERNPFLPVAYRTDCPEDNKQQRCFELSTTFRVSTGPEGKITNERAVLQVQWSRKSAWTHSTCDVSSGCSDRSDCLVLHLLSFHAEQLLFQTPGIPSRKAAEKRSAWCALQNRLRIWQQLEKSPYRDFLKSLFFTGGSKSYQLVPRAQDPWGHALKENCSQTCEPPWINRW